MEEPGRLQSIRLQRVGHNRRDLACKSGSAQILCNQNTAQLSATQITITQKKKNLSYTFNIDIKVIYCSFLRADYFIFQHFRKLILVKAIKNIISEKYSVTNGRTESAHHRRVHNQLSLPPRDLSSSPEKKGPAATFLQHFVQLLQSALLTGAASAGSFYEG